MLYLMMDKSNSLVKVGYSKGGVKTRRKQYYGYNPAAIMRSACAGTRAQEIKCREKLVEIGATRIKGTEWFKVSEMIFANLYVQGMSFFRPNQQPIHFLEE